MSIFNQQILQYLSKLNKKMASKNDLKNGFKIMQYKQNS
jgi:hypothetical protein